MRPAEYALRVVSPQQIYKKDPSRQLHSSIGSYKNWVSFAAVLHHVEERLLLWHCCHCRCCCLLCIAAAPVLLLFHAMLLFCMAQTSMINSMPAISDAMHRQADRQTYYTCLLWGAIHRLVRKLIDLLASINHNMH